MAATNCSSDSHANLSSSQYIIFVTLHSTSSFFAVFGNILVLVSFMKTPALHYTSNYFLISLSFADLTVGLLINPLYIALTTLEVWLSDHFLYIIENVLWIQTLMATTFSLAAVSIDRYLAVTRVFTYVLTVTSRRCKQVILTIWLVSIFSGFIPFYTPKNYHSLLWTLCLIITFGIPLVIIILCYFKILKTARYQARQIASMENDVEKRKELLRNNKAAYTIAIIISCFVVTFTPSFVFACIELNTEDVCRKNVIYRHWLWGIWVSFLSSTINPWIYAIRSKEFRKAMKKVLQCK